MSLDLRDFLTQAQAALEGEWSTVFAILLVLVVMVVALRLLRMAVHAVARGILQREREPGRELAQKAKTLSQVVETTGQVIIFTVAILTVLSLMNKDVTPLLASAGIAGIAVGFGAQNLIKDWLGGFFILLENQYSVDDVIKVGEQVGVVEKLDLRKTVLRSTEGAAIVIPNGEVRVVTNLTKEWSRVVMDVGVPYEEDIDHAIEVLCRICREVAADPGLGELLLEAPEVLGIEGMDDQKVTIRLWAKTLPSKQWTAARAIRALVKKRFDEAGIGTPYPHQVTIAKTRPIDGREG
jgi:small conductance mechanosensitive channel